MVQVLWENIGALIAGATISMLSWTLLHLRGSCDEDDTDTDIDDRKSILLCEGVGSIPVDHENFRSVMNDAYRQQGCYPPLTIFSFLSGISMERYPNSVLC